MSTSEGYDEYIWGCSVHQRDMMSTLGDVQYIGGNHDACGGYHEYIGILNINQRLLSICSPTGIMISP